MNKLSGALICALLCGATGQALAASPGDLHSRYEKLYDSDGYNYGARVYVTNRAAETLCVTPFLDPNRTFNISPQWTQSRFTMVPNREVNIGAFVESEEGDWDIGVGLRFVSGAC